MKEKTYKSINNIIFAAFLMMSAYALIKVYILRSSVPEGMCPVENYRPLMFASIGVGIASFVFSFLKKWLVK
jgi:hypothetical protein